MSLVELVQQKAMSILPKYIFQKSENFCVKTNIIKSFLENIEYYCLHDNSIATR